MKRYVALLLIIFLCFTLLSGCAENGNSSSTENSKVDNKTDTSTAVNVKLNTPYTINGIDISKFSVIRPHYNISYLTQIEIDAMVQNIKYNKQIEVSVLDDKYTDESDYEIVVGNCNRENVEKITDYNSYNITFIGNKVYLNGGNTYSTAMAVSEFCEMLISGTANLNNAVKNGSYSEKFKAEYDSKQKYHPVWVDDFDSNEIDSTKWDIADEEYANKDRYGKSGQNGKNAYRTPQNVQVFDGMFHAFLTYDDENYYSGTIRTNNHLIFQYGYVETSCKLPQGNGFWSTLWMRSYGTGTVLSPEIDVNECFGDSSVANCNAHVLPSGDGIKQGFQHRSFDNIYPYKKQFAVPIRDNVTLKDDFHTYGVLWTQNEIAFIGDGKVYCSLDFNQGGYEDFKEAFNSVPVNMILAGSPGFSDCPLSQTATDEEWEKYSVYYSDYVHLYQLDDGVSYLHAENRFIL